MPEIGKNVVIVLRSENFSRCIVSLLAGMDAEPFTKVTPIDIALTRNHHLWVIDFLSITI